MQCECFLAHAHPRSVVPTPFWTSSCTIILFRPCHSRPCAGSTRPESVDSGLAPHLYWISIVSLVIGNKIFSSPVSISKRGRSYSKATQPRFTHRSTRYSLWIRRLIKLLSSINSSRSNPTAKLSMQNMEHPWRKYCLETTASTEPAPVEASKVEVQRLNVLKMDFKLWKGPEFVAPRYLFE